MLLNTSFSRVLEKFDHVKLVRQDMIIPSQWPPVSNSPYRHGYDWLFGYERQLAKFLEPWLKGFRYELIGEHGIICEALSNAFCHGNRKDAALGIEVGVFLASQGILLRIKDHGNGFDVKKTVNDFSSGNHYYHLAGNGLRLMMHSQKFGVFFNERGTAFHLLYTFDEDLSLFQSVVAGDKTKDEEAGTGNDPLTFTGLLIIPEEFDLRTCPAVSPEKIDWAKGGLLFDVKSQCVIAFGISREKILELVQVCQELCSGADQLNRSLAIGDVEYITVLAGDESFFLKCDHESQQLFVVILHKDANPALARIHHSRLIKHLAGFQST